MSDLNKYLDVVKCAVCNFMLDILVILNRNIFQSRNMIGSKWKGLINGNNTSQGSNTEVIEVSQGNQTVVSRWKWHFIGHYSITVITKNLSKIKSVPFLAAANPLLMLIWNLIFRIHCKTIQIKYPINSTIELWNEISKNVNLCNTRYTIFFGESFPPQQLLYAIHASDYTQHWKQYGQSSHMTFE